MTRQLRNMTEAQALATSCDLCGCDLDHDPHKGNTYSPLATHCRDCADGIEFQEQGDTIEFDLTEWEFDCGAGLEETHIHASTEQEAADHVLQEFNLWVCRLRPVGTQDWGKWIKGRRPKR